MLISVLLSLLMTVLGMKYFIVLLNHSRFLKRKETIDSIKKSCIKELHKNKQNTLTMGGVVMNSILLIMSVMYYIIYREMLWFNSFIIFYGLLGFIDDYIKIKKVKDGVAPKIKLAGLIVISSLTMAYLIHSKEVNTVISIPFTSDTFNIEPMTYIMVMIFFLVTITNSVNITDGLDGLALGISAIVLFFITIVAWQKAEMEVLFSAGVILAACLGTLMYNKYPAKIFIGDTGSLFLGGAMGIFMIKLGMPLWSLMILSVCLWEMLTVVIQLSSLKLRGKRVFKIAPYHHHLEKCGWPETKIVYIFWLITGVSCVMGYIGLKGI